MERRSVDLSGVGDQFTQHHQTMLGNLLDTLLCLDMVQHV